MESETLELIGARFYRRQPPVQGGRRTGERDGPVAHNP